MNVYILSREEWVPGNYSRPQVVGVFSSMELCLETMMELGKKSIVTEDGEIAFNYLEHKESCLKESYAFKYVSPKWKNSSVTVDFEIEEIELDQTERSSFTWE